MAEKNDNKKNNEQQPREAPPVKVPISRLLSMTIQLIKDEANRRVDEAFAAEKAERGLPPSARIDETMKEWIIPAGDAAKMTTQYALATDAVGKPPTP